MSPTMYRDLRGRMVHFLTYGDSEVVDGETHAQFKDRAALRLADLLCLFPNGQLLGVLPPRHGCQSFWPFDRPVGVEIAELEALEVVHGLRPYAPKGAP